MKAREIMKTILSLTAAALLAAPVRADYVPADPMRFATDEWMNRPGLMSRGGVPNYPAYTTLQASTYGNGATDATSAIQSAVDACPAGRAVVLGPGTFTVNGSVLISRQIVVRGSGPGVTIVQKTNGAQMNVENPPDQANRIFIIGPGTYPGADSTTSQNLTADGAKGAYSVTIASAAGIKAGDFVLLDELSGASWQHDVTGRGEVWASENYRVTWMTHRPAYGADDPVLADLSDNPAYRAQGAGEWFSRMNRVTCEMKEVAGVSGNTVTFTSPLHINYRAGATHQAQLTRYTATGNGGNGGVPLTMAGVEDLTIRGSANGAIHFTCAAYCWARNVEVTLMFAGGVYFNNAFRCELRDSYLHDSTWAVPASDSYLISMASGSSELLIENNILVMADKVMVARACGAGTVVGYNYADQGYIRHMPDWIECGLNASHMVGPHHVLFEGNYGFNWDSDHTHGNSIYMTVFRNWLRGVRRPFVNPADSSLVDDEAGGGMPARCVGVTSYSLWMSFVGNVLGAKNKMGGWVYESTGANAMFSKAIWLLGWDDAGPQPGDEGLTKPTVVREGNWDWLNGVQSWDTSPVTLQDSLYLSAKPAFFGGLTWPWVDPITGATHTLPAMARYEAILTAPTISISNVSVNEGSPGAARELSPPATRRR